MFYIVAFSEIKTTVVNARKYSGFWILGNSLEDSFAISSYNSIVPALHQQAAQPR